jgi:uncharacterized protein (DUF1501 family)
MKVDKLLGRNFNRRDLLQATACGMGVALTGTFMPPILFSKTASAAVSTAANNRILVVVELSGGNDGLNTIVPHGDDAYYRLRPKIGVKAENIRKIDDYAGFHKNMLGFERLYQDGKLAVVHGAGYDNPSFSHFVSMAYWHTGAPHSGAQYGWVGRTADVMEPTAETPNLVVNVDVSQSLAVRSQNHVPLVFDDPNRFKRNAFFSEYNAVQAIGENSKSQGNPTQAWMANIAETAYQAEGAVRQAWADYDSPIKYGLGGLALRQVAALIEADFPTRLYYLAYRNNSFDTHVYQVGVHERLLTYTCDPIEAFMQDMERIGRADDVVMMTLSEFGRRVPENTSLGTDHGTAGPMFVVGKHVKGGQYSKHPDLNDLVDGNMKHTVDFRSVYATVLEQWLGVPASAVLGEKFDTFDMIA